MTEKLHSHPQKKTLYHVLAELSLQPCWSHQCWSTLSCWVAPPCQVGSCRVIMLCWVDTPCRVVILCRVGNNCRVIILCRVGNHCRVCRPCQVVTCSWVGNLCWAHHICRVVLWSWTSWRLDDSNGPSLWLIKNGSCQINLSSGHMSRPRMVRRVFALLFLLESLVKRRPRFREPMSADVTQRFSGTQRKSVIETTLLAAMMVVTATPKVRATREFELWFLRGRPVMWFRHLA